MEIYNNAIQLLKNQDFLRAEQLLFQLSAEDQQTDEVKWTLGLIQIYLGKPYQAIEYWEKIKDMERFEVRGNIEKVKGKLPRYDQLYQKYNEALTCIREKKFDLALTHFIECLKFKDALPIDVYEGYINLSYYLGEDDLVEEMLEHAPKHVLASDSIRGTLLIKKNTKKLLQENKKFKDDELNLQQKIKFTRKQRNKLIVGSLFSTIALVTVILITIINNNAESEVVQNTNNEPVRELEQKIVSLEEQLANSRLMIEKLNEKELALQQKDISLDKLLVDVQKEQYQSGYYYYKNGQYDSAQKLFQESLQFKQDTYYADDAHYYLIQSKIKMGDFDLEEDYLHFITSDFESYQQSPFFDDILLQYAQSEIGNQNNESAKQLLNRITTEYSQEWTAQRAKKLLNELAEL